MAESKIVRSFPATLDSLEPIRNLVQSACEAVALGKKKTYNLCLAIDEIATNIIKHGYLENGIQDGTIEVLAITDQQRISVSLEDHAVPFDPIKHQVPDESDLSKALEDRPIGGLGVMIARNSVDKYEYEFRNNKNRNIFIMDIQNEEKSFQNV